MTQSPQGPDQSPQGNSPAAPTAEAQTDQEAISRDFNEALLSQQSQVAKDINRDIETD